MLTLRQLGDGLAFGTMIYGIKEKAVTYILVCVYIFW